MRRPLRSTFLMRCPLFYHTDAVVDIKDDETHELRPDLRLELVSANSIANITCSFLNTGRLIFHNIIQERYQSNYNSGNLCRRFCLSVYLKFDFQENRSHDSLQTRPMCCSETRDVQYDLSLYGCILLLELNDFCVLFSTLCYYRRIYRPKTSPPTVAHSVALLADDTGRS